MLLNFAEEHGSKSFGVEQVREEGCSVHVTLASHKCC